MIVDSGNRREFETGAVRDIQEGKGRCDLLPLEIVSTLLYSDNILHYIDVFKQTGNVDNLYFALLAGSRHGDGTVFENAPDMLIEVSKHFEEGAKKYGEYNWQKGIPVHCYIDSAVRHYLKWLRKDEDERHDRAFVWNILCCIWTMENKPELDDFTNKSIIKEG